MTLLNNFSGLFTNLNSKKIKIVLLVFFLSFILSPGLLLTLPKNEDSTEGIFKNGYVYTRETNELSMIVHSIIIAALMYLILTVPMFYNLLGIQII